VYLPRKLTDLKAECSKRRLKSTGNKAELVNRLAAYDLVRSNSTLGGHRPTTATSTPAIRTGSLMQGFNTSASKQAVRDTSTIDFFVFPEIPQASSENLSAKLRVPLLPDNYNPDRSPNSPHAAEVLHESVPRPEISIIASHPENIAAVALSEVVGNDGIDVHISELTAGFSSTSVKELAEPGLLRELWNNIISDLWPGGGPKIAL